MSQLEREVVRRMRCGEYLPDTVLEDGRLLAEPGAAGLFAATAARFRKLEISLRRTTWRFLFWFVLGIAGIAGLLSDLPVFDGMFWSVSAILLLLVGGGGVMMEMLVFLTRLWKLMPCTRFPVAPGWRIFLWIVPFFSLYWSFLVFPPLRDFPDQRPSSPEVRSWQLKMLYYIACFPVLNVIARFSRELWFGTLIALMSVTVTIVFYLIFRAKACRRAGYLAEIYEATAVTDCEVAPEWSGAWRRQKYGGWKMAGWIVLILIALWQIDAANQQRRMPSAEFREKTVASFAAGIADDAQVSAFRKLAEAIEPQDCDDDSASAMREWLRKNELAAAALGRFFAEHPDFRLSRDWTQGYAMNEQEIDAVGCYGDLLAAAIGVALEEKNYGALPKLFRQMADAAEFLRREGTMTALRCGMWILNDRNELILKLAETPEAWRSWSDEALLELAIAENRRENDWRRAESAAVDFAVVAAMDLRQLPDAACLNQSEQMFGMYPEWFYWYRLSWPGIREWRRYFNAIRPYRQLLEVDGEKMKKKQDDWCDRYLVKSDLFVAELIDLLDAFLTDRTEFRQGQRQTQIEIARERYRRDHGGRNPEVDADVVPRYLPKVPVDPDSGEPYDLSRN